MEIPDNTIEAFARNFHREAKGYGFGKADYLRFVNAILDQVINDDNEDNPSIRLLTEVPKGEESFSTLPIIGSKLSIRKYNNDRDQSVFEKWLNDEHGRYFLLSRVSMRRTQLSELVDDPTNIIGTIALPSGNAIGAVAFLKHDPIACKAELRKIIGEIDYRGQGYAKLATQLWIEYGRFGLGLKKIYLNTLNTNLRNIRINEELGFTVEGILRNEVLIDGVYQDVLRMGLLLD